MVREVLLTGVRDAGRIRAALPTRHPVREGRVRHTICTTLTRSIGFGDIHTAPCQRRID